jgi:hypothetical protein
LTLSPDGKVLALAGQRLELWDAASGDEIRVFSAAAAGPNDFYRLVAFAPDGRTLATAGADATVQLWEVATGKDRLKLRVPVDAAMPSPRFRHYNATALTSLAFSRDNDLLAVGGADAAIRLYDLASGRELPPLSGHSSAVRALAFTPNGRHLVSFDSDGLRLVWNVSQLRKAPPAKLPALSDGELEDLWNELNEADAFHSYRALRYFTADPKRALALFRSRVKPAPAGDADKIDKLVADLQNANPAVRRKAMGELRKHGEAAYGALSRLNDGGRAMQSVQILLNKLEAQANTPDRVRSLKAVAILERIGGADAKELVEKLAGGAAGVPLTVEAKAALDRWPAADAKAAPAPVTPAALWNDLASDDGARAYRAIHGLAAVPKNVLPLLREHLKPAAPADPKQIDRLLADLDSTDFATRQQATTELGKLGPAIEPALKKARADSLSAEVRRRLDEVLERIKTYDLPTEVLRNLRALEVLERLDPKEATPLLEALAKGPPDDRLTREARAALRRRAGGS